MLVNEWVDSFWSVLSVRPKTLHDYKRLYRRHLEPVIGAYEIDAVPPMSSLPISPREAQKEE